MVTIFLLFRINSIIDLKPFNFYLSGAGEGPLAGYPLFNPAHDFLFTLRPISRLTASFIILPSRLKISGRKN